MIMLERSKQKTGFRLPKLNSDIFEQEFMKH